MATSPSRIERPRADGVTGGGAPWRVRVNGCMPKPHRATLGHAAQPLRHARSASPRGHPGAPSCTAASRMQGSARHEAAARMSLTAEGCAPCRPPFHAPSAGAPVQPDSFWNVRSSAVLWKPASLHAGRSCCMRDVWHVAMQPAHRFRRKQARSCPRVCCPTPFAPAPHDNHRCVS